MSKLKSIGNKYEDRPATLDLRGNHLEDIRDLHVDDVVELVIKAKVTRKEEGGYSYDFCCDEDDSPEDQKKAEEANKKKVSASFKIQSIKSNGVVNAPASNAKDEAGVASRFNQYRKQGLSVDAAMAKAKRG